MTKRIIDADAFEKLMKNINDTISGILSEGLLSLPHEGYRPYADEVLHEIRDFIEEIATPAPEPQENKSNLTKFNMQLFEVIGQNVEAGKIAIDDDDFDKMETIAFRLIDAMNLPKDKS